MKYQQLPYLYDVLPFPPADEPWQFSPQWRYVEGVFRETCRRFAYREIRTPILEQTELFNRHIGKGTDIVSKEMFSFKDRGNRDVTLKPEGTASVVRACIETNLFATNPILKLYYIGQNFRAERGQRGRYRQHQQLGVEVFGVSDPQIDAEVIALALTFFRNVGITETTLRLNSVGEPESRVAYVDALREYARPYYNELTGDGKARFETNPLRMLDTKDDNEIKIFANAPRLLDYVDAESREHFEKTLGYLDTLGIAYEIDHSLVRGFDYYTRTAFEIRGKGLGSQDALGGGGRYDRLTSDCGGPAIPGIGFGLGMERCLMTLHDLGIALPIENEAPEVFLIVLGEDTALLQRALQIMTELRSAGIVTDRDYRGKRFGAQVKQADLLKARFTLILGDNELAKGVAQLRNQQTKEQREIPLSSLIPEIRAALNA